MDYRREVKGFTDSHREDMIEGVCRPYKINSKKMPYMKGKPYGGGTFEILQATLLMAESYGLSITNYDNHIGATDLNDKEGQLDILAHLDIVSVGEKWAEAPAYRPAVKDGKLFGRGTVDGRGPVVITLYAMRAVKELRIPLNKNVRLIPGTDEECGSSGIAYYYGKEKEAPMTFSPDAEFPVINTEERRPEGHFHAESKTSETVSRFVEAEADVKASVVPGKAGVTVEGISLATLETLTKEIKTKTGISFSSEGSFPVFRITVQGEGVHASTLQEGKGVLTGLLLYLTRLPLAECGQMDAVKALVELFPHGDTCGKAAGTAVGDELSGAPTLVFSMLTASSGSLGGISDSRHPICSNEDNVLRTVKKNMVDEGVIPENETMASPHRADGNPRFVKTLLACYEEYAGLRGSYESTGGGTYVYHLKNGTVFGAALPDTDNRMHDANEFAVVDELVVSVRILARAIVELCRQSGTR